MNLTPRKSEMDGLIPDRPLKSPLNQLRTTETTRITRQRAQIEILEKSNYKNQIPPVEEDIVMCAMRSAGLPQFWGGGFDFRTGTIEKTRTSEVVNSCSIGCDVKSETTSSDEDEDTDYKESIMRLLGVFEQQQTKKIVECCECGANFVPVNGFEILESCGHSKCVQCVSRSTGECNRISVRSAGKLEIEKENPETLEFSSVPNLTFDFETRCEDFNERMSVTNTAHDHNYHATEEISTENCSPSHSQLQISGADTDNDCDNQQATITPEELDIHQNEDRLKSFAAMNDRLIFIVENDVIMETFSMGCFEDR